MRGFNDESRLDELEQYHREFFDRLIEVFGTRTREYSRMFYRSLFPSGDNLLEIQQSVDNVLKKCPPEQDSLKKMLRETNDELRRRIKTYNALADSIKPKF
jgi:hypothetical protein